MTIDMHLKEEPFERIKAGIKRIEYRVNDDKRQQIKTGDTIVFYKMPLEEETIVAEITDLKYYPTLLEMYSDSFDQYLKDCYRTPQEVVDNTTYYSQEEIEKYGCVAIHFQKKS